jgi:hypothetical protein
MVMSARGVIVFAASLCTLLMGCSPTDSQSNLNPEVNAELEQTSAERQLLENEWRKAKEGFAQAASLYRFMMQHSASVEDTKAWALVADTHEEWATQSPDQFVLGFEKSCVPSVTSAFDRAGSNMIQYGKDLGTSTDPKALKLSPKLVAYGSDLANMNALCEKAAQDLKDTREAEKAASQTPPSYEPAPAPSGTDDHPYAKAAGQIIGLTLATALVGGLLVLDYTAARGAASPTIVEPTPTHCTSYQVGMYTNTNCY